MSKKIISVMFVSLISAGLFMQTANASWCHKVFIDDETWIWLCDIEV